MPDPSPPPHPPRPAPAAAPARVRLQFSMRSLLVAMTIAAFLLPLIFVFGQALWSMLVLGVIFLAPSVGCGSAAVYSRGRRRTFFGGAACAGVFAIMFVSIARATTPGELFAFALGLWAVEAACGLLALGVRGFAEKRGWDRDA